MKTARASGVLLHISSLPGEYMIGDMGSGFDFVNFLASAGQKYWQFLPIGPCGEVFSYSPYMGTSSFAGNVLYISPDLLVKDGYLPSAERYKNNEGSKYSVDYQGAENQKSELLYEAFNYFDQWQSAEYQDFLEESSYWLDDYAVFVCLKNVYEDMAWCQWPIEYASHNKKALVSFVNEHNDEINFVKFCQYLFFNQWQQLKSYANDLGVKLIGDIPIYVGHDSSDVWAHQNCFQLNKKTGLPTRVAGVPPDYFSETGQRWGNPLYKWNMSGKRNDAVYSWWQQRFTAVAKICDMVRIDHFRGFESYWSIPVKEETAINGKWLKGPGAYFFERMSMAIGNLEIIAEDLGVITPAVEKLRDQFNFPGMKILQFGFSSDAFNSYLPHNYKDSNCLVYPGTHDNDTCVGWFFDQNIDERTKKRLLKYCNSDGKSIHQDFIRLAQSSIAKLAIIPMQDILGFGSDCRMNRPGIAAGNWQWRLNGRFLTRDLALELYEQSAFYGRVTS